MATNNLKLYRLPKDVKLEAIDEHLHSIEYYVSFPPNRTCPFCTGNHCVIKDYRKQSVHHLPLNRTGTFMTFTLTRFLCKDCNKTFWERPEWLHPDLNATKGLFLDVFFQLSSKQSINLVAANCGISPDLAFKVLDAILIEHPSKLPEAIGIDEFSGDVGTWNPEKKHWEKQKLICNISDLSCLLDRDQNSSIRSSWVIDILPEISLQYLKNHFTANYSLEQRKEVKFFCCDMHSGFLSLARSVFPNAKICFDMFHIVQRLNRAITLTRIRTQRSYCSYKDGRRVFEDGKKVEYDYLQKSSRVLIMNETEKPINSTHRQERLQRCFKLSPDLEIVYSAVQEFHALKKDPDDHDIRPALLTDWVNTYKNSDVPELRDVVRSIVNWRTYILNTWKYTCSNASCEGLNREIKDIKRIACGYHDFERFRKRILLTSGPMKQEYQSFSIRKEKIITIRSYGKKNIKPNPQH